MACIYRLTQTYSTSIQAITCPQGFTGSQRRRDMDVSEMPHRQKVPLPLQWKSEEHVVINSRNTEENKETVRKQIPWRQQSARANNQFVLCWLQANHGLNAGFRCLFSPASRDEKSAASGEWNQCLLSIKKLPRSSEADNIYSMQLKLLICIQIYTHRSKSKYESEKLWKYLNFLSP